MDWIEQAVDCLPMMSPRTLVTVTDFDLFSQGDKGRDRLMELLGALPNDAKAELVRGYLAANQMLDYLFEQTKGE